MRVGIESEDWEDYDDLPLKQSVRKTKFRDPDFTPQRVLVKRLPQLRIPTPWQQPTHVQEEHDNLLAFASILPAAQESLLRLFVYRNGLEAVANSVRKDLVLHPDRLLATERGTYGAVLMRATGTVHERLSYLWLEQQRGGIGTLVADPGAASRIFRAIRSATGAYLHPDGTILTDLNSTPTMAAICEYKTNFQEPEVEQKLQQQVDSMSAFIKRFGGSNFDLKVTADTRSGIRLNHIAIAKNPEILLVTPFDRRPNYTLPGVSTVPTPFSHDLITAIALRCATNLIPHSS